MILWVILFLLIIVMSFVLAFLSMRDYHEIPGKSQVEYGLFLIRQTELFNHGFLDFIRESILKQGLVVSIERLFKGKQTALTIFGPKKILTQYAEKLNLLELEDYTLGLNHEHVSIWEVGTKIADKLNLSHPGHLFQNLPALDSEDQFLWQVTLGLKGGKDKSFRTQIRAAIYSKEPTRRKDLAPLLQNLCVLELIKIPRPFSQSQLMDFYKLRSLSKDSQGPTLGFEEVIRLVKVS